MGQMKQIKMRMWRWSMHKIITNCVNNMTSLSFEHDLDLEENVEIESTKSNVVVNKKKYKKTALRQKYKTTSTTSSSSSSSPDLLKEITKVIANQRGARNSMDQKQSK